MTESGFLSSLFDEGDDSQGASGPSEGTERLSVERANPPRNETKLCGLANQGATCYLNALLQTLHFTPEFRQELFKLRTGEMGTCSSDTKEHSGTYRLIPIQLQRLSARLLLAEEQCISTAFLTDSFGWSDNEELFQHDVDEMNRILFSAIEQSLKKTSGEKIISTLYHGSFVNQITCQSCGVCREIKEDFQHIPVTVVGLSSLQESLQKQFIHKETLEGDNKYHCGACDQLVDAVKGCRLTHLPPILSIALMRFQYDFAKNERYKETRKFSFPQLLDMNPYVESPDASVAQYELFSVVIHGGSTYGGHYKAYIRDIQDLGNWVRPEEERILVPASKDDRNPSGYSEYTDPVELLVAVLLRLGKPAPPSDVCEALREQTGISWSQRFKTKYGNFLKFIKKHPETFLVSEPGQKISLHPDSNHSSILDTSSTKPVHCDVNSAEENSQSSQTNGNLSPMDISFSESEQQSRDCPGESPASKKLKRQNSGSPPPGYRWFEFNDRCVRPIHEKSISTMFSGKESAYMLFYRRAEIQLPAESMARPEAWLQDQWVSEVCEYNKKLERARDEYELHLNSICVHCHYAVTHCFVDGILQHVPESESDTTGCLLTVSVDRRRPMAALTQEILGQSKPELLPEDGAFVLHEIRDLPGGFHLYEKIPLEEGCEIKKHLSDNDHVFVWNGLDIHGSVPPVGADSEPVLITLTYPDPSDEMEKRDEEVPRQKDTLLSELRADLLQKSGIPPSQVVLSLIKEASYEGTRSKKSLTPVALPPNKDTMTLAELGLENGSQVIAERKGKRNISYQEAAKRSKTLHLRIEDRCTPTATLATPWRAFTIDICFDEPVSALKLTIVEKLEPADLEDGCRIRLEDDSKGLTPPVHEDQTLKEAGMKQNQKIVIEKGLPPTSTQITVCYHISPVSDDLDPREIQVEKTASVEECLALILSHAGLSGGWHLRKTNWCCEAAAVLEDEEQSLEDANVRDGNYLLVEEGRLPPKGYIRVPIYQLIAFPAEVTPDYEMRNQELHELEAKIDDFLARVSKKDVKKAPSVNAENGVKSDEHSSPHQNDTSSPNHGSYTPKERELSTLYPPLTHTLQYIDQIDISQADTLDDLKCQVMTLPGFAESAPPLSSCLRVQEIIEERPQRVFKDGKQTLKKLKIGSGTNLAITSLTYEEVFPNSCLLLRVALHIPQSVGQFLPANELIFDTSVSSSPTALLQCLSQSSNIPVEFLRAAKYRMERFDWTIIREAPASSGRKGRNRKGKTPPPKPSVRNPPFNLKDNEFVGIKDIRLEPEQATAEWCLEWDGLGLKFLKALQEDKKRKRREKKGGDVFNLGGDSRSKRPERIPYIFVGDYDNSELMDTDENGILCLDENFDGNVS